MALCSFQLKPFKSTRKTVARIMVSSNSRHTTTVPENIVFAAMYAQVLYNIYVFWEQIHFVHLHTNLHTIILYVNLYGKCKKESRTHTVCEYYLHIQYESVKSIISFSLNFLKFAHDGTVLRHGKLLNIISCILAFISFHSTHALKALSPPLCYQRSKEHWVSMNQNLSLQKPETKQHSTEFDVYSNLGSAINSSKICSIGLFFELMQRNVQRFMYCKYCK